MDEREPGDRKGTEMIRFIVSLGIFALLWGCQPETKRVANDNYDLLLAQLLDDEVPLLTLTEAMQWEGIWLDTRTWEEYQISHIPGAIWVGEPPLDSARLARLNPDQPILAYCSIGYRSEEATRQLREAGFHQAYNLYGGIFEWANRDQVLENIQGMPTDSLHGYNSVWSHWVERGIVVYDGPNSKDANE